MYDARLPEKWARISWMSTTLGFWFTELLERDAQFRRWCYHGRPKVNAVKEGSGEVKWFVLVPKVDKNRLAAEFFLSH